MHLDIHEKLTYSTCQWGHGFYPCFIKIEWLMVINSQTLVNNEIYTQMFTIVSVLNAPPFKSTISQGSQNLEEIFGM